MPESMTASARIGYAFGAVREIGGRTWKWGRWPASCRQQVLLARGAALGTVPAFMMSVLALSLPEMVILRKVLKVPLLVAFAAIVGCGILLVGYVVDALL